MDTKCLKEKEFVYSAASFNQMGSFLVISQDQHKLHVDGNLFTSAQPQQRLGADSCDDIQLPQRPASKDYPVIKPGPLLISIAAMIIF